MKSIHVTMTNESMDLMQGAADYMEMPISVWARTTLIEAARSVAHKRLCSITKAPEWKWAGKPCTQEQYEKWSADAERYQAKLAAGS